VTELQQQDQNIFQPVNETKIDTGGQPVDTNRIIIQHREPAFRFSDSDTDTFGTTDLLYPAETEKLFGGHQLEPVNSTPVPYTRRTPDWFTIVLLFVIIGFTWIRVFYSRIFKQLFAAFLSNTVTNQIVRDENILIQRASVLMSFIFYLSASLFLYQVSIYYNWNYRFIDQGILRLIIIALVISFAYSMKMVILKALGTVFDLEKPVATYIFNIFLINNVLGITLIPVVIIIAFVALHQVGTVINVAIFLIIIAFIYRLVRAIAIWKTLPGVSLFYLILYFCTLEFAPLLIIARLAIK
jgi:hypothetical protein